MIAYREDALKDLYDFFHNAPIGLHIVDPNGTIRRANQTELRMLGYEEDPGGYVGHHIAEFHADQSEIERILETLLAGGSIKSRKATVVRKGGSLLPVIIHSSPRMEGDTFSSTRCFTYVDAAGTESAVPRTLRGPESFELHEMTRLGESERDALYDELDDFFENGPVALHIVGADGIIKRANRAELENLGYLDSPGEYIGHHIAEFHADQHVIEGMLQTLIQGDPLTHHEARLLRKDGSILPVFIYSSSRMQNGEFVNTRCFTFPAASDDARGAPKFEWPRNEGETSYLVASPTVTAQAESRGGRTAALRYLSGRKRVEESLGLLAKASEILNSTPSCKETVPAAVRLTVPVIADWCAVYVLTDKEIVEKLASAQSRSLERVKSEVDHRLTEIVRGSPGTGTKLEACSLCLDLASVGAEHEHLRSFRHLGVRSIVCVPIHIHQAQVGVLCLLRADIDEREAFGAADVALAEELGRRLASAIRLEQLQRQMDAMHSSRSG